MTSVAGTPALAPLYPAPPYTYANAQMYSLRYPLSEEALTRVLPECLSPPPLDDGAEHTCALVLARYPESSLGAYDEVYWLVPARYGEERGWFCPFMYLTSDAGLAAGRELWGFPKKLAAIEWRTVDGRQQVVLSRGGKVLLSTRFECTEAYDVHHDEATPERTAIYNLRVVAAAGPGYVDETYVTATYPKQHVLKRAVGLASVRLGDTTAEPLDLLAPPDRRVPIVHTLADITLPPVDIAHRLIV